MLLYWIILAVLLGYVAGVVVNYLSDILPVRRRLGMPLCTKCGADLTWKVFLTWKQCSSCGSQRVLRHWLAVAGIIAIAVILVFYPHVRLGSAASLVIFVYLGLIFIIDIEHRLILYPTSYAGILICGAAGIFLHGIVDTMLGGAVGFAIMLILYFFGNWFGSWLAKRKGVTSEEGTALGFGDVMLAGVLGLLLGWPGIIAGIFLAIILAGVFSLLYLLVMVIRRSFKAMTAIPYAPFLVISAVLLLFIL